MLRKMCPNYIPAQEHDGVLYPKLWKMRRTWNAGVWQWVKGGMGGTGNAGVQGRWEGGSLTLAETEAPS